MSRPVPYWRSDRSYFGRSHTSRDEHMQAIEISERIDNRIAASSGDGSYSVLITRKEIAK